MSTKQSNPDMIERKLFLPYLRNIFAFLTVEELGKGVKPETLEKLTFNYINSLPSVSTEGARFSEWVQVETVNGFDPTPVILMISPELYSRLSSKLSSKEGSWSDLFECKNCKERVTRLDRSSFCPECGSYMTNSIRHQNSENLEEKENG